MVHEGELEKPPLDAYAAHLYYFPRSYHSLFSINYFIGCMCAISISHRPAMLAEHLEEVSAEGEWPVPDKEVIFDGECTCFESGDMSSPSSSPPESPVGRLQAMAATKLFCSITLSIISTGTGYAGTA
jgi:hypothetical protein